MIPVAQLGIFDGIGVPAQEKLLVNKAVGLYLCIGNEVAVNLVTGIFGILQVALIFRWGLPQPNTTSSGAQTNRALMRDSTQ